MKAETGAGRVEYVLDGKYVLRETGARSRRYHYGEGEALGVSGSGGADRWLLIDGLGSVSTEVPVAGAAVVRQYDAWGNYRNGTAPTANEARLGYTGHQFDVETGLTYARARYYDSKLGVFLSRDSFEGVLADAPSLHRFSYAHNSPLRYVDPSGRCDPFICVTAAVIILGLGTAVAHDDEGGSRGLQAMALPPLAVIDGVSKAKAADDEVKRVLREGNTGPEAEARLKAAEGARKDGVIEAGVGALATGGMVKPSARASGSNLSRLEGAEPPLLSRPTLGSGVRQAPKSANRQMSKVGDYYEEVYGVEAPGGPSVELEAGGPRPPFQPTGQRAPQAPNPFFPNDPYSPESVAQRQQANRSHYGETPPERLERNPDGSEAAENFDQARRVAFERARLDPQTFNPTKQDVVLDAQGNRVSGTGTYVEFKGPKSATVDYDAPHPEAGPGHDAPHVGWKKGGKSSDGPGRGNVTYPGPQHPNRPPRGQGDLP